MEKPTISYKGDLLKDLRDVDYRGKYLSASLRESTGRFCWRSATWRRRKPAKRSAPSRQE